MNLKTKRLLLKAFADFIAIVVAIAGEAGVAVIEKAFEQWQSARTHKSKTPGSRARRKKS